LKEYRVIAKAAMPMIVSYKWPSKIGASSLLHVIRN